MNTGVLFRKTLLWTAISTAIGTVACVQAQDNVSAPDDEISGLDEVIVTARRTDERLQDVPISITVFSQEQLDSKNIVNGGDLATYTPSLTANTRYSNESTSFAIRGFSQEVRTTASVGTYFADVVMPRANGSVPAGDNGGPGMFFDLQNVQVLKGPQGTLNGRNTTGGAILLVPQEPTANTEGYLEQSAGNYSMLRTQAVFNAPLSDSARFRIGMDKLSRDGYIKNTSGIGPKRFSDIDYTALRASLIVDLTDELENYTILSWSDSSNNGPLPKVTKANPDTAPTNVFGQLAGPQAERQQSAGYYSAENADPNPGIDLTTWGAINTTTWTAADDLTVKNIVSYAQQTYDLRSELFGSNFYTQGPNGDTYAINFTTSRPAPGLHTNDQATMTEEFQLQGEAFESALNWQAGLYFEYSKPVDPAGSWSPGQINCTDFSTLECYDVLAAKFAPFVDEGTIGSVAASRNEETFKSTGIYSQGSYDLTEELVGTVGLRYTTDSVENDSQDILYRFPSQNQAEAHCLYPDTVGGVGAVSDISLCDKHRSTRSEAPTWVLGLDYKPSTDLLIYGKYSRGYRQGSLVLGGADGYLKYDPEKVDTYELGFKTSFDSLLKGKVNMALFYNDFTDQQVLATFSSIKGAPTTVSPINAGSSRIYGAEFESTLLLVDGLTLDINYAYLNTKIEDLTEPTIPGGGLYNTLTVAAKEGDELTYTPSNKLVVSVNYQLPLSHDIGVVSASGAYSYTGSQLIVKDDIPAGLGRLPSNELVSANINWMGIYQSSFDASIFVTNLLDKEYKTAFLGTYSAAGFSGDYAGEPRMFGARVRYNFGI